MYIYIGGARFSGRTGDSWVQLKKAIVVVVNLVNVGFTEVIPTVGGERELISNHYTDTSRMISALKLAVM